MPLSGAEWELLSSGEASVWHIAGMQMPILGRAVIAGNPLFHAEIGPSETLPPLPSWIPPPALARGTVLGNKPDTMEHSKRVKTAYSVFTSFALNAVFASLNCNC